MTLNTAVYVMSEENPHEVFWRCRELLGAPESLPVHDEPSKYSADWNLRNPGGVGLGAWLWIHYVPGEMRRPRDVCEEYCDDDCDGSYHEPPHWFVVTLDTAYGYRGPEGQGCGALHAQLVAQLGQWLDERGVRWAWKNEFTGETHVGDRYKRLMDLFGGGDDARRWFEEIVTPIIALGFGHSERARDALKGTDHGD